MSVPERHGRDHKAKPPVGGRNSPPHTARRRQLERRKSFRIVYPPTFVPKVLNGSFRISNLSRQGILLIWEGERDECRANMTLGSTLSLQVQFHDGEVLDLEITITRCQSDLPSRQTVYAGTVDPLVPAVRISKEEAYLLRHVPDFCRVEWYSVNPMVDD